MNRKFGGGKPPTGTPSLAWSSVVVVVSLLAGASIVHNIYKPNLALGKIRCEGLNDKSKLDSQPELFIRLVPDKANKTLSIIDSGIGMTKADSASN